MTRFADLRYGQTKGACDVGGAGESPLLVARALPHEPGGDIINTF
jgi:hypothetical protein